MSSVPYVPPETIKKVAATNGQSCNFRDGFRVVIWGVDADLWKRRAVLDNFDGYLLKRPSLSHQSPSATLTLGNAASDFRQRSGSATLKLSSADGSTLEQVRSRRIHAIEFLWKTFLKNF